MYKYMFNSKMKKICWLLLQVKSGTIFDNILVTDDEKHAEEVGKETWGATKDPEKKMKDEQDEEERKKREEEEKKRKEEEGTNLRFTKSNFH